MKKILFGFIFLILLLVTVSFLFKIFIPLSDFKTLSTTSTAIDSDPLNLIPGIINSFINKPILGIHYRMIDKQSANLNSLAVGAYITQIIDGSPAQKANLLEEDIITQIDGRDLFGQDEQFIYNLVSTLKPGTKINLTIWRNKEVKTIFVTLD